MKDLLIGLRILCQYINEETGDSWTAEHDQVLFSGPEPSFMKEHHVDELERLGFTYDEMLESWHYFS